MFEIDAADFKSAKPAFENVLFSSLSEERVILSERQ